MAKTSPEKNAVETESNFHLAILFKVSIILNLVGGTFIFQEIATEIIGK